MTVGTKRCTRCGLWRVLEQFSVNHAKGYTRTSSWCKECVNDYSRERRRQMAIEREEIARGETDICTRCGETRGLSSFLRNKGRLIRVCRVCCRKSSAEKRRAAKDSEVPKVLSDTEVQRLRRMVGA